MAVDQPHMVRVARDRPGGSRHLRFDVDGDRAHPVLGRLVPPKPFHGCTDLVESVPHRSPRVESSIFGEHRRELVERPPIDRLGIAPHQGAEFGRDIAAGRHVESFASSQVQ